MRQNNGLYVSCPACGDEESEAHGRLVLLRTLCISVLFTMPLMWSLRPLIQFLLATVVQFWPGMYFYKGAYRALRQKILGMDFLVALSTTIIYVYSAYITFTVYHNTKLYFLSECVLLSLILFGKYMETTSRYEASAAIRRLISLQPETAHMLRGGAEIEVGLNEILPSDSIVIRSGDHIPIDGVISDGECFADESMLTGESELIRKQPGDTLYCGTLCRDGQVLLSCGSIGKTTMLQQIIDIVSNAQSEKAPIARLADRIATVFVPIVVIIAAAVFCRWYFFADKGNLAQAVNCVCATLVIACPCALGLATPTAIMTGSGRAAELGILFRGGEQLERAYKTDTVIFDKTGTLTCGMADDGEIIRSDAKDAVEKLKASGIDVWMISGDKEEKAKRVAGLLGIENVIWEVKPSDKADAVKKLQAEGRHVAMVGDGINDAPALTRADMGIAIGAGTDVAIDAADVVLMKSRLSDVPAAIRLSRATLTNIHENLFWAFFYNVIGIPLAMGLWIPVFGWKLNPMFGAAAMSLSSFCVVSNALRLNFFDIRRSDRDKKIKTKIHNNKEKESNMMEKTLKVEGMMCPHCEATVKKALEAIDGVSVAEADHVKGTATVTLTKDVPTEVLKKAIEDKDYKVIG